MKLISGVTFVNLAFISALLAGGGVKQNPTAPNAAELHVASETVPPGGTVQVKVLLTEPRPITSTGSSFYIGDDAINGVSLWSSTGQAGGIAVVRNKYLNFEGVDPSGNLGLGLDYPLLTFTATVGASAVPGARIPLALSPGATIISPTGPLSLTTVPGTLTVSGSVNIHGVYPGGGTWPAGTQVRILGSGFSKASRLQTAVKYSAITITPNEIDLILKQTTTLDSIAFQVGNPDGSSDTYYSYLRGTLVKQPTRSFLQTVEPAFPTAAIAIGRFASLPASGSGHYFALALQNPTGGPLVVTFQLSSQPTSSMIVLPATTRVVEDLSMLLNGITPLPGDTLQISATSPVQVLGIAVDELSGTAHPVLVQF